MHFVDVLNIGKDIIKANKKHADKTRDLLNSHGIAAFDFMGAIGSGKTLLIEYLINELKGEYKIACIAGDVIAKYDAGRMEKHVITSYSIHYTKLYEPLRRYTDAQPPNYQYPRSIHKKL